MELKLVYEEETYIHKSISALIDAVRLIGKVDFLVFSRMTQPPIEARLSSRLSSRRPRQRKALEGSHLPLEFLVAVLDIPYLYQVESRLP